MQGAMKNKIKMSGSNKQLPLHLMMLPSVIIIVIYAYLPIFGIIIAFQKYKPTLGFLKSKWIGWHNFERLFSEPAFFNALFNTLYIAILKISLGLIVPVIFSLLLNEVRNKYMKKSVQTIIYLPHFISWVLMAGIVIDLLSPTNGLVNQVLEILNIKPIFFLGDNRWFPIVLVTTHIWKEFGWGTIIILAAITSIDPNIYEAAIIDGANRFKQMWHITIPGISSIVILIATLNLGQILNAGFDQVYNLLSPITYESGDIIDTLVYRMGIEEGDFSMATATGLFKSVVSFFLITTSYKLAYRYAGYKIF